MSGEGTERESNVGASLPNVAVTSMVSTITGTSHRRPENFEPQPRSVNVQSTTAAPLAQIANLDRFEAIRRRFKDRKFSEEVIDLLLDANRPTTRSSYQSARNGWCDWCARRNYDPILSDLGTILQYLTDLFNSGYATRSTSACNSTFERVF